MSEIEVGGIPVWNEQITGDKIPGSTRIPVVEISEFFDGKTEGLSGLDLGSGQGRSTKVLEKFLIGSKITALDLSFSGLSLTQTQDRVQAKAEELPFKASIFDFINVCGVMTNIVDEYRYHLASFDSGHSLLPEPPERRINCIINMQLNYIILLFVNCISHRH